MLEIGRLQELCRTSFELVQKCHPREGTNQHEHNHPSLLATGQILGLEFQERLKKVVSNEWQKEIQFLKPKVQRHVKLLIDIAMKSL